MSTDLKLGLNLGYWQRGADDATELVQAAERLGYESVWTTEAYGSDAFTPLAWYGARTSRIKLGTSVVQISARTPAATAMTAMTAMTLKTATYPRVVSTGGDRDDPRSPHRRTAAALRVPREDGADVRPLARRRRA
ncbi:LLM class flavin-dependent oxidoreductase [Streptosporangium sp. NBC_01810]|uniref:LLM class flavin-dependent oxidoreductase n=1 Tax=Streptosporangium sp. NBC_01810 TaxID=2975951 RepID=UPI002DDBD93B|nr:LLM class flavin-dependent oxidoreductase [Streptosporangium sp. NBC_01810]